VTVVGWWSFHWLCDDAYLAFRYVRMSVEGHGYVWNPSPFRPVEGYTSFLWVVILDVVWRLFGVDPPTSAPALSLVAHLGALAVVFRLAHRVPLASAGRRLPWLAFVVLAVVTNRTWLTWTSSGLETALWLLVLLAWLDAAAARAHARLVALAAVLPLVRPDGLLFLAATPALVAVDLRRERPWRAADLTLLLPYLLPVAHLLWRRATYDDWLPNTYYAKVVETWLKAGGLHIALFSFEHALFLVGPLVLAALWRRRDLPALPTMALGVMALQLLFLLRAGGDHFEYRIFLPWVPILWLAVPWACERLGWSLRRGLAVGVTIWLLGLPLPWTHWAITSGSGIRYWEETHEAIAPHWPAPLRAPARLRDWVARWNHYHLVGTPHHLHRAFLDVQIGRFPEVAPVAPVDDLPIWAHPNPGYVAYHHPELYVIDMLGLNDHVIARWPAPEIRKRKLAHERFPPAGYVDCFRPNVVLVPDDVIAFPRAEPFGPDDVRSCEDHWWALTD
ncbi:MAG: hypothetical protein KC656_11385, partial [Myxococcales bacterium]|nr:hypothetical protein [Myxococcales bacterium]